MQIQVIDKQDGIYRLLISQKEHSFCGVTLWGDSFIPIKAGLNNYSLCWNIGKKKVSYKQIAKVVRGWK